MLARSFGWGVLIPLVCFAGCQLLSGGSELHTSPDASVTSGPGSGGGTMGNTCSDDSDCASGFCADDVCCDSACEGTCQQCDSSPGDTVAAGTCRPVPAGYEHRDCPEQNVCDRNGACVSFCDADPEPLDLTPCPNRCATCGDGTCFINCNDNACQSQTVNCPQGMDCRVMCNEPGECMELALVCPEVYGCFVTCSGPDSCNGSTIKGTNGKLDIICSMDETACEGMMVNCGPGRCQVNCVSPASVELANISNDSPSCNLVSSSCQN